LHDCGSESTLKTVDELISRVHWTPERFIEDGKEAVRAFEPATAMSLRLAIRATKLSLEKLCHVKKGEWDCVWDVPVDVVMLYCVAQEETAGTQFMNPSEYEMVEDIKHGDQS